MGDPSGIGRFLIVSGVIIAAIGLVIVVAPRVPGLNRLGRLPGDIFIERGSTTIAIPLVSSIVISVVLTILLNLFLRR
jgi:hypothetical protein